MPAPMLALTLPALPALSREATVILSALVALVTLVILGRALLAVLALRRNARSTDELAVRLEADMPTLAERFAAQRGRTALLNGAIERGLWSLPTLDRRVAVAERRLAELRLELDTWRGRDDEGVRRTIESIRGTLGVINTVIRLRRAIKR